MDNLMGAKELYDVVLKATYDIDINGQTYSEGEVLLKFDNILMSNFNEIKSFVSARGGYENQELINWEKTREIQFNFSQGIFSKQQLALLSNSNLIDVQSNDPISISCREEIESDEYGRLELKHIPNPNRVFAYNKATGEKVQVIHYPAGWRADLPYTDLIIDYTYDYVDGGTVMAVGQRLVSGYLSLEGKTRLKDDITGHEVTGIIKIPRLRLTSNLSMRLGKEVNPMVANFSAVGVPVGDKGNKKVMELIFLNDDIDSDM